MSNANPKILCRISFGSTSREPQPPLPATQGTATRDVGFDLRDSAELLRFVGSLELRGLLDGLLNVRKRLFKLE